jgi:hypothetical protein
MRKKLIAGVIAAVLGAAVPATPAFAIHDGVLPFVAACSGGPGNSQAIGHPATGHAQTAFSNTILPDAAGSHAQGGNHCHFD